jgi:hypothetical protein
MSSRSLAAARARRAGDAAPPVSGNRPGTSVGSAAAFSNMPQPPNNVRVARPPQQQQQYSQQQQYNQQQPPQQRQQSAAFQQIQQSQTQSNSQPSNGVPFTKLSISDAIGLITLRLGRVEQWVIETQNENDNNEMSGGNIPDNSRIVDNSVFASILNRLESVEKKEPVTVSTNSSEEINKLTTELSSLNDRFTRICDEANKQTLTIAKHTEQLFRFERELIETKDILKTFMMKYDSFVQESNEKLADYEFAISEIEKSIAPADPVIETIAPESSPIENLDEVIDLKSLVKQELENIN